MRHLPPVLVLLLLCLLAPAPGLAHADDPPPDNKPLDVYFAGKVVEVKHDRVTLRYDFASDAQMRDWTEAIPFKVPSEEDEGVGIVDGQLEVKGSTGIRHVAEWKGDIEVTCKITPLAEKDIGGYLAPGAGGDDFATFTLIEKYFHHWDRKPGGDVSIIKFGDQWRKPGAPPEFVGFRYVTDRHLSAGLHKDEPMDVSFGIEHGKLVMSVPDVHMKGRDLGKPLRTCAPGFYTIAGKMHVDDVQITGTLDPKWLEEEHVVLETSTPPEGSH
jgi:hypothetical protein